MDIETATVSRYRVYPLIPLRGICVFPGMRLIFDVERAESLAALNAAMEADQAVAEQLPVLQHPHIPDHQAQEKDQRGKLGQFLHKKHRPH